MRGGKCIEFYTVWKITNFVKTFMHYYIFDNLVHLLRNVSVGSVGLEEMFNHT